MSQQIQPQPVPTSFQVQQVPTPQGMQVAVVVQHVMGTTVLFLDPDAAQTVGKQLQQAGQAGNLILPTGPLPAPETTPVEHRTDRALRRRAA